MLDAEDTHTKTEELVDLKLDFSDRYPSYEYLLYACLTILVVVRDSRNECQ
jgi:hypothetical protein